MDGLWYMGRWFSLWSAGEWEAGDLHGFQGWGSKGFFSGWAGDEMRDEI